MIINCKVRENNMKMNLLYHLNNYARECIPGCGQANKIYILHISIG